MLCNHSFDTRLRGFMFILPVNFLGHLSQKYKNTTFNRFASKILFVLDSQLAVDNYMIHRLFILFLPIKMHDTTYKGTKWYVINFSQLKETEGGQAKKNKFFTACCWACDRNLKKNVNQHSQCNPYNMLSISELKAKSPDIMNCGLKATINRQGDKIIEREYNNMLWTLCC